jgi:hypothetical protein
MSEASTVNTIRNISESRDRALDALWASATAVRDEIAQTTKTGPYLDQLTKRYRDLMNERAAIRETATDLILAQPGIIDAVNNLNGLSTDMTASAQSLRNATDVLAKTAEVLSLGQRFSDLIANAHKG